MEDKQIIQKTKNPNHVLLRGLTKLIMERMIKTKIKYSIMEYFVSYLCNNCIYVLTHYVDTRMLIAVLKVTTQS